jgi:hypothetical protein
MPCKGHQQMAERIEKISTDVAIIKNALMGNGREGLLAKTDRHDRYFNMFLGVSVVLSIAVSLFKLFPINT